MNKTWALSAAFIIFGAWGTVYLTHRHVMENNNYLAEQVELLHADQKTLMTYIDTLIIERDECYQALGEQVEADSDE